MVKGLLDRLRNILPDKEPPQTLKLEQPIKLGDGKTRIPIIDTPLAIHLGDQGKVLHLLPAPLLDDKPAPRPVDFHIVDPDQQVGRIHGFLRLESGSCLELGRDDECQQAMFDYPNAVARRHLEIRYKENALVFRKLSEENSVRLSPIPADWAHSKILARRNHCLREIRNIYGGPIEPLDPQQALKTLKQINALLEREPMRPRDKRNQPGGVVEIPAKMTPIIIGDLHAQVDNLLTLLSQNEFLEALGDGSAAMLFLGDAVHKEVDGEMEEMESSLLMMDLIFRLKLWFPQQVFYIRGNHDCFNEEVGKDGIPQGLLWERMVRKTRGKDYKREMDRFYELLPYVTLSGDFIACHAAPPKSKVDRELLINVRRLPGLIRELTCNRLYAPNRPAGYTKGDVKRLRKSLDLAKDTHLFVGHTPLNRTETLWSDVGGIPNHHVVFSGNNPWIGVFTRIKGQFIPLSYHTEPVRALIKALSQDPPQAL